MARLKISLLFLFLFTLSTGVCEIPTLTIPELISYWGYPFESHPITTSDGYVLEFHRIPHGAQGDDGAADKPVVLLLHGLFGSSARFTTGPPHQVHYGHLFVAGLYYGTTSRDTWFRASHNEWQ